MGITRVTLHANLDVGGYAWAKYGFKVKNAQDAENMLSTASEKVRRLGDEFASVKKDILEAISKYRSSGDTTNAPQFLADLKHPDFKSNGSNSKVRDGELGKWVLLNSDWYGYLDLDDKASMKRLRTYLKKKK